MHKTFWKLFCTLLAVCLLLSVFALPAQAQTASKVRFSPVRFENKYPDSAKFSVHISSSTIIEKVSFFISESGEPHTRKELNFTPGQALDMEYTFRTHTATIYPGAPISVYWQVIDGNGVTTRSKTEVFYYSDTRFKWKSLETEDYIIMWHDRPQDFGEMAANSAKLAFKDQTRFFGLELEDQARIVIYNSNEEYFSWFRGHDWSSGSADPRTGITAQVVEEDEYVQYWMNDIIPHEISHLFFHQATYNVQSEVPVWLNEGTSVYNEYVNNSTWREEVAKSILSGDYIPLSELEAGFDRESNDEIDLSYGESYSAVHYLIETYGEDGMRDLLAAYKKGYKTYDAFLKTLGVTPGEFEKGWLDWLGVPEELYATPQPSATPTPRPAPLLATPTAIFTFPSPTPQPAEGRWLAPLRLALCPATLLAVGLCLGLILLLASAVARGKKPKKPRPPAPDETQNPK